MTAPALLSPRHPPMQRDAPTPDPAEVAGVIAGLSKAQRLLIPQMSDGELVYPLARFTEDLPGTLKLYRDAAKGLRALGLAAYGPLMSDEGETRGSGTWLTSLGLAIRHQLQKDQPDVE